MQKNLLQHEAEADSLLILCLIVFRLSIRARSQHCGSFFVLSALTNPCCTLLQRTWCWYRLTSSCISKISSLHACPEYKGCRCQEPCCQGWLCFFCMPVGNPACHRAECWATALIKLRGQCYWFFSFSTLPRSPRQKRCSAKTPKPSELFLLESVWGKYWGRYSGGYSALCPSSLRGELPSKHVINSLAQPGQINRVKNKLLREQTYHVQYGLDIMQPQPAAKYHTTAHPPWVGWGRELEE